MEQGQCVRSCACVHCAHDRRRPHSTLVGPLSDPRLGSATEVRAVSRDPGFGWQQESESSSCPSHLEHRRRCSQRPRTGAAAPPGLGACVWQQRPSTLRQTQSLPALASAGRAQARMPTQADNVGRTIGLLRAREHKSRRVRARARGWNAGQHIIPAYPVTWISLRGSDPPPLPGFSTPVPAGPIDSVTLRFGPHPAPGLASSSQDGQQRRGGRAAVLACPAPVTAKPSLWVKCPL